MSSKSYLGLAVFSLVMGFVQLFLEITADDLVVSLLRSILGLLDFGVAFYFLDKADSE